MDTRARGKSIIVLYSIDLDFFRSWAFGRPRGGEIGYIGQRTVKWFSRETPKILGLCSWGRRFVGGETNCVGGAGVIDL